MEQETFFKQFLKQYDLPVTYEHAAKKHFVALAERLLVQSKAIDRPLVIGVNGSQGSGKSTLTSFLVAYLSQVLNCQTIGMSIDDFYLTKSERQILAQTQHPLLATRGVPGTHDLGLLNQTIESLLNKAPPYLIPVFLKAIDDRAADVDWQSVSSRVKVIILEGWCVGCPSQSADELETPVNFLEVNEDVDGHWRSFANQALQEYEQTIFNHLDRLIMLKAPGFHIVKQWRSEQEHKLRQKHKDDSTTLDIMTDEQLDRFIAHYQRITEHGLLKIPDIADDIFLLDEHRSIVSVDTRST